MGLKSFITVNLTCFFLVLKCGYWEVQSHTAARTERPGTAWEEGARAARPRGCHPLGGLGPCLFCEPERSTYFQGSGEGLEINPCEQPRAGAWYLESALSCRPLLPGARLVGARLTSWEDTGGGAPRGHSPSILSGATERAPLGGRCRAPEWLRLGGVTPYDVNCRSASRSQKQSAGSATGCLATRPVYSDLYRKIKAGPRTRGKRDGRRSGPSTALFVRHSRPPRSSAAHAGLTPSPQAPLGSGFLTTRTEGAPAGTVGPRTTREQNRPEIGGLRERRGEPGTKAPANARRLSWWRDLDFQGRVEPGPVGARHREVGSRSTQVQSLAVWAALSQWAPTTEQES